MEKVIQFWILKCGPGPSAKMAQGGPKNTWCCPPRSDNLIIYWILTPKIYWDASHGWAGLLLRRQSRICKWSQESGSSTNFLKTTPFIPKGWCKSLLHKESKLLCLMFWFLYEVMWTDMSDFGWVILTEYDSSDITLRACLRCVC